MKRKSIIYLMFFAVVALIVFSNSVKNSREYTTHIEGAMDTATDVTLITNTDGSKVINEITEILNYYDKIFSHTDSGSEIYKINTNETTTGISEDTYDIIKNSKQFYENTGGAFDITIGAVSNLWNETFKNGVLPDDNILLKNLETVGYNNLIFDDEKKTVGVRNKGQEINLGSVAKGYAADKIKVCIDNNKVNNALINLGGNIYAKGKNKNGQKWNIGIADPRENGEVLAILKLSDKFVITSGNYIRYADIDSVRYHHIINAKTGYPVQNELNSVTIISDSGFIGDALSTSCYLLGFENSKPLLDEYGVDAVFVTKENKVYYSKDLEVSLQKESKNYEYIPF